MKVLKFGAEWCPGCVVMKPKWKEIESENEWLETAYFDTDKDSEMVTKYGVRDLPTFIYLDKNDEELERQHGIIPKSKIVEIITKHKDK